MNREPVAPDPDDPRWSISALADGEGLPADCARGLAAWAAGDAAARASWHSYHLIGDVLRSGELASPPGHDQQFLAALQLRLAAEPAPALIIVDLSFRGIDPPGLIARLKGDAATRAVPILAFGSHLDHAARDAAKGAGADRVVPNSKLAEDLPALVERYALPSAG